MLTTCKKHSRCASPEQEDGVHDENHLDEPKFWHDLILGYQKTGHAPIYVLSSWCGRLKETKVKIPSSSKLSKLSSLLHMSTMFKDIFDAEFEEQRGILAAFNTRGNSTLRNTKAGCKEWSFTAEERILLKELVDI
ncbi:hypothetical protein IRJ41_023943 [Scomber scombrus]|uniref:Uncharacterized protein n=1 Tax=Scomber scombrus TaxID=13677 RepID=A0AAV1P7P7_SCOSC